MIELVEQQGSVDRLFPKLTDLQYRLSLKHSDNLLKT